MRSRPSSSPASSISQSPAYFLSEHWRPGTMGAFRMGLHHGSFCVGCC
ncbi:MAG: DUF2182 domain-containing protein [Gemmatimonadetes bacterium]|nr:DUF2182 domain-containing protein [Gemmatimonadota bacterium]